MTAGGITLHVGLPKCASSALQAWADANRQQLAAEGVTYPPTPAGLPAPKHQQIVSGLQSGDLGPVESLLSQSAEDRLLLSSEGLSNHLYDVPQAHLRALRDLFAGRCETVVLMCREPSQWVDSYWRQCLVNPTNPKFGYGLSLTRDEFAQLPRVQRLLDLDRLSDDLAAAYGAARVVRIDIREDWLAQLKQILMVDLAAVPPAGRWNVSIGDDEAELMRCVNGAGLAPPLRGQFMALMQRVTDNRSSVFQQQSDRFAATLPQNRAALLAVLDALRPDTQPAIALAGRMRAALAERSEERVG